MRTSEEVAAMSRCGFRSVRYLEVKNTLQKRFGTKDSVRCSEFRGGRFSEVANVLQVWDFQSVTRTLSALGSVSASRSVHSGRFYCIYLHVKIKHVNIIRLNVRMQLLFTKCSKNPHRMSSKNPHCMNELHL